MKLSPATEQRFAREVAKYPADQKQSAVMACLAIVQQEQGYVSAEAENAIAAYLGMPPIAVHEVTTFYNMYNQQPVGQFKLNVCTNLPCQLRNGQTATEGELREFCRAGLAHFKAPHYWKFVTSFPTTVTGKIQKFKIRELAIEELGLQDVSKIETA